MDKPTCKACVYFEPKSLLHYLDADLSHLGNGLCHHHPQHVSIPTSAATLILPFMPIHDDNWCGCHPSFAKWIDHHDPIKKKKRQEEKEFMELLDRLCKKGGK